MEKTPENAEDLRQHFSRRASAARIAARNPNRDNPPMPLQPWPLPMPLPEKQPF